MLNVTQVKHELQHLISGESGTSYDALIQAVARHLKGSKRAGPMAEEKHEVKGELDLGSVKNDLKGY